jgi:hypothetical protein
VDIAVQLLKIGEGRGLPAALLVVFLLGLTSAAIAHGAARASLDRCAGRATRVRPGRVRVFFLCVDEPVFGFGIQASRRLLYAHDDSGLYGCGRRASKEFECSQEHSDEISEGFASIGVSEPLCPRARHLAIHVTAQIQTGPYTFLIRGPC